MSKYQFKKSSIYYDDSSIPANKAGIKEGETLHLLEESLLHDAFEIFVSELHKDTCFDEEYFKSLHLRTFSSLFNWAGVYRDFDMAKDDSIFCRGEFVANESEKLFNQFAEENYLKNSSELPIEIFAKKLAYYKCELIMIHPFYELNGRITRLFFDLIAMHNGYKPIDYSKITSEEYINASISCVQEADSSALEKMIQNGLKKL